MIDSHITPDAEPTKYDRPEPKYYAQVEFSRMSITFRDSNSSSLSSLSRDGLQHLTNLARVYIAAARGTGQPEKLDQAMAIMMRLSREVDRRDMAEEHA